MSKKLPADERTISFFVLLNRTADAAPPEQRANVVEAFLRGWNAGFDEGKRK